MRSRLCFCHAEGVGLSMPKKLLETFGLDSKQVTGLISDAGIQTHVYKYGDNKVLKLPKLNWVNGIFQGYDIEWDYHICLRFLGEYIPHTEFHSSKEFPQVKLYLQDYIPGGRHLDLEALANPILLTQFKQLVSLLQQMYEAGFMVDIIGGESFYPFVRRYIIALFRFRRADPYYSNVMVTPQNRLMITDFKVSNRSRREGIPWVYDLIIRFYAPIHWRIQRWFIDQTLKAVSS